MSAGVTALTGVTPLIFEPANCSDSGAYGGISAGSAVTGTGLAYGLAGSWGNLQMPLNVSSRPQTPTTGLMDSWLWNIKWRLRARRQQYVDLALLPGQITDADIQATICRLLPVNATAWLRII